MNLPEEAKRKALEAGKQAMPYLAAGWDVMPTQVLPPQPPQAPAAQKSVAALPDEVKRQATAAMGTAMARTTEIQAVTAQQVPPRYRPPAEPDKPISTMPDEQKRQASAAMGQAAPQMQGQNKLVDIRDIAAQHVAWQPGLGQRTAERIASLQRQGHDQDRIHQQMTQKGFCMAS